MTDSNNPPGLYRRVWPELPRIFDVRPAQTDAGTAAGNAAGTDPERAVGTEYGQPPTELIAHLVIALSRYFRQLRQDGREGPAQLEQFTAFLATHARLRHDASGLDWSSARCDAPNMPRRLLITKSEAAEQLGVSLRTIERVISAGRLPLVHVEGAARVRVADLEAYVQGLDAGDRNTPPDTSGHPAVSPSDRPPPTI